MRLLVFGGTRFVSRAVAAEGVRRGHEVVCAARGSSGPVPEGARLVEVDRDVAGGLEALAGEPFDAVVDVARMSLPWVREALRVLGEGAGHWTFVSSVNVYADTVTPGQDRTAPLLEPLTTEPGDETPDTYGSVKVAAENAVRDAVGYRAFVVRPGLVVGPDDLGDRFGYWSARFARGGKVAVPDAPDQPIQYVDVRDLAAWIIDAGEQNLAGTYDAVCPPMRLAELLDGIADVVAAADAETVPVPPGALSAAGIQPWAGPKSLPLWLPDTHRGLAAREATASLKTGLHIRPLADTVRATLAHERSLGLDRPRKAGLTPAEEAELLG